MRTRRLHVRLAYVVRVDNRASIAYAAAPARSVRHGVVSPEVLMRSLSSQCHASRIKKSSAFGARHQCEGLSAGYTPRQHPATIKILSRISVREIFLVSVCLSVCSSAVVNGSLDLAARAMVLQAFLFDEAKFVAA